MTYVCILITVAFPFCICIYEGPVALYYNIQKGQHWHTFSYIKWHIWCLNSPNILVDCTLYSAGGFWPSAMGGNNSNMCKNGWMFSLTFEQLYEPVTTDTLIEKAGGRGGGETYSHWLGCIYSYAWGSYSVKKRLKIQ